MSTKVAVGVAAAVIIVGAILGPALYLVLTGKNSFV